MNLRSGKIAGAVIIILMFAMSAWAWVQVPAGAEIPIHWGADGTPDGYGGKAMGLLALPLVAVGIVALFLVLPRIEPRRINLEESVRGYTVVWVAVMAFMALIHLFAVLAAVGRGMDMNGALYGAVALLYIAIGVAISDVRSNFFFGIRTAWTLSSELSWTRTHRLGGRLFVLLGIVVLLSSLAADSATTLIVAVGGAVLLAAVLFGYSYMVWRDDPDKDTTGRRVA